MLNLGQVMLVIVVFLPVYSAVVCFMLTFQARRNSFTRTERRTKTILLCYFPCAAMIHTCLLLYNFFPLVHTYVNPLVIPVLMLTPMLLYRFVWELTLRSKDSRFPWLHYLPPVVLLVVMGVWSLFVPFDVQLAVTKGKGVLVPGYEGFSRLYICKPWVNLVFSLLYITLSITRLYGYYRFVGRRYSQIFKPVHWIWLLMVLASSLCLMAFVGIVTPRSHFFYNVWVVPIVLVTVMQHIILTYNTIRRNFQLFTDDSSSDSVPEKKSDIARVGSVPNRDKSKQPLNRKRFETYFDKHKPYLNPDLKITDLVDRLKVNRSYISHLINSSYGVNFNRYVNQCRLKELDALRSLPDYAGSDLSKLIATVGFSNMRQYNRAKRAEEEAVNQTSSKITES